LRADLIIRTLSGASSSDSAILQASFRPRKLIKQKADILKVEQLFTDQYIYGLALVSPFGLNFSSARVLRFRYITALNTFALVQTLLLRQSALQAFCSNQIP
jgi:hypothetical protein